MHLLVWLHFATALWLLWELKEQTIAARATRFMRIHERAIDPTRAATDDEMGEYAANLTKAYQPFRKHSLLFGSRWPVEWFDERFVQLTLALDGRNTSAVSSKDAFLFAARKKGWLLLETEGVYSFPMFSQEFCKIFLEEVDNYDESGLPAPRPNSMNNYGIIVNLIGMKTMVDSLQQTLLQPLAALLFPGAGDEFNRHHAFMVRYKPHEVQTLQLTCTHFKILHDTHHTSITPTTPTTPTIPITPTTSHQSAASCTPHRILASTCIPTTRMSPSTFAWVATSLVQYILV
jgi:hypothetical protein